MANSARGLLRRAKSDSQVVSPRADAVAAAGEPPRLRDSQTQVSNSVDGKASVDDVAANASHKGRNDAQGQTVANSDFSRSKKEWIIDMRHIELTRRLGTGGSSEVWEGVWQGLHVAVKILYRQGGHVFPGITGADAAGLNQARHQLSKQMSRVEKAFRVRLLREKREARARAGNARHRLTPARIQTHAIHSRAPTLPFLPLLRAVCARSIERRRRCRL